jgi:transposase-like protein
MSEPWKEVAMGFLGRLFGKDKEATTEIEPPPCPHTAVVARWENPEDMGKEERVSSYLCTSCQKSFSREEAVAAGLV